MANAFKKMAGYLGLVDDEEDLQPLPVEPVRTPRVVATSYELPEVTQAPQGRTVVESPTYAPEPAVIDEIFTIHPRFYNEARTVGERYREGRPVLMNLGDMEESERKRLVDFASGLVFGHHGTIERVTSKVFLLTPPGLRVSSENKAIATEASFFNQS